MTQLHSTMVVDNMLRMMVLLVRVLMKICLVLGRQGCIGIGNSEDAALNGGSGTGCVTKTKMTYI